MSRVCREGEPPNSSPELVPRYRGLPANTMSCRVVGPAQPQKCDDHCLDQPISRLLDPFIPAPDVRRRHSTFVHAPSDFVHEAARNFDMQSIPVVHAIFWLRATVLRARGPALARGAALVPYMQSIGWGVLVDQSGRAYVAGAACQPWQADVVFSSIPAKDFAAYAEPGRVKIVWSLETEPVEPALTRLSTETRVVATDEQARAKFRRYWRTFGMGILLIRWLLLPAVRRDAERQWKNRGAK
jgi:hypothetical protein